MAVPRSSRPTQALAAANKAKEANAAEAQKLKVELSDVTNKLKALEDKKKAADAKAKADADKAAAAAAAEAKAKADADKAKADADKAKAALKVALEKAKG